MVIFKGSELAYFSYYINQSSLTHMMCTCWRVADYLCSCLNEGFTMHACMHAKSFQSCLTLCDAVDCSPPGSSVHGIFLGKNTGVGCHALLQGIFQTQGLNSDLLCLLNLSFMFLAFAGGFFTTSITWEAWSSP